jgi:putative redox protein
MKNAKVTYVNVLQFVGVASSGHAIVMDSDPRVAGNDTGSKPMELLLMGIGGCSGMDTVSILQKKKQYLTGLEIKVKGEDAEDHLKKFTDINLKFIVKGRNVSEDAVKGQLTFQ